MKHLPKTFPGAVRKRCLGLTLVATLLVACGADRNARPTAIPRTAVVEQAPEQAPAVSRPVELRGLEDYDAPRLPFSLESSTVAFRRALIRANEFLLALRTPRPPETAKAFPTWLIRGFSRWHTGQYESLESIAEDFARIPVEEAEERAIGAAVLGICFRALAHAVEDLPKPAWVEGDAELAKTQDDSLSQIARPYRDKSVEAFRTCYSDTRPYEELLEWRQLCAAVFVLRAPASSHRDPKPGEAAGEYLESFIQEPKR